MRGFTKSVFSYTWSTSLFGLQQMANFLTPQGWRQPDRATQSLEKITKATAEEMSDVVRSTFKVGDEFQRRGVDLTFDLFTMGMFDRGKAASAASSSGSAKGTVSNIAEQATGAFTAGLQAVGQTVSIVTQSVGGIVSGQGCAGSQSGPTGWGPVPPPPGN